MSNGELNLPQSLVWIAGKELGVDTGALIFALSQSRITGPAPSLFEALCVLRRACGGEQEEVDTPFGPAVTSHSQAVDKAWLKAANSLIALARNGKLHCLARSGEDAQRAVLPPIAFSDAKFIDRPPFGPGLVKPETYPQQGLEAWWDRLTFEAVEVFGIWPPHQAAKGKSGPKPILLERVKEAMRRSEHRPRLADMKVEELMSVYSVRKETARKARAEVLKEQSRTTPDNGPVPD